MNLVAAIRTAKWFPDYEARADKGGLNARNS